MGFDGLPAHQNPCVKPQTLDPQLSLQQLQVQGAGRMVHHGKFPPNLSKFIHHLNLTQTRYTNVSSGNCFFGSPNAGGGTQKTYGLSISLMFLKEIACLVPRTPAEVHKKNMDFRFH